MNTHLVDLFGLGLGLVTWSLPGGGLLNGKYRQGEKSRAEALGERVFQTENSVQLTEFLETLLDIAGELGLNVSQVAIALAGNHGSILPFQKRKVFLKKNICINLLQVLNKN